MIGCDKSEVNLLGICDIDLGVFVESQVSLALPKMITKKYKLEKCNN